MLEALVDLPLISDPEPTDPRASHRELLPLDQALKAMEPHWSELELSVTLIISAIDAMLIPACVKDAAPLD